MNEQQTKAKLGELRIAFFKMIGAFVVLGLSFMIEGFTFLYLWNGIMPTSFGLTSLSYVQSVGVTLLIKFVGYSHATENKRTLMQTFLYILFANLIFLFTGWVVMLFI